MSSEVSYYCALCRKNRYVRLDLDDLKQRVKSSPNGLVEISDIHRCVDGQLSINNLHVDGEKAVRSFSLLELPDKKRKSSSIVGMPVPSQQSSLNTYRISNFLDESGYRLRLMDDQLNISMNIGYIPKGEEPEAIIISKKRSVRLEYFECDVPLRKFNRAWFDELVNALEELPPTRLGLFIESLRYVWKHNDQMPGNFEIQQLRTLLSSHKTTFTVLPHNYKSIRNLTNKYGKEKRVIVDRMLSLLEENPNYTLQDIQVKMKEDLVFLIFLSILLEIEGVIEIHRDKVAS